MVTLLQIDLLLSILQKLAVLYFFIKYNTLICKFQSEIIIIYNLFAT